MRQPPREQPPREQQRPREQAPREQQRPREQQQPRRRPQQGQQPPQQPRQQPTGGQPAQQARRQPTRQQRRPQQPSGRNYGSSTVLGPPSMDETQIVPTRTADQWARQPTRKVEAPDPPSGPIPGAPLEQQPGAPRTANERRAAARREAALAAAASATKRRAERRGGMLQAAGTSIAKAGGSMAIATLVSRLTGFLQKVLLAAALGIGALNDGFNAANNLPNMLLEFVLGGVLTSVAVPVMVRARKEDPDGGEAYTQRLLTMSIAVLGAATIVCVIAAPLLIKLTVSSGPSSDVARVLAYLLLPEIFFYGLSALFNAILNARDVFGPTAWSSVANNIVAIATLAIYMAMPGKPSLDPASISDPKLLVLGVGTTLGIVVQAFVVVPSLRRSKFRFRWRWGLDSRLSEFGKLALWSIAYVGISQVAVIVLSRVSTTGSPGGLTIYNLSWLLVQLPYAVIGFSLLTAILPRMSRAAADGDTMGVLGDLSFATRMTTVMLGPISAVMTVLGPQVGLAMFSLGQSDPSQAARLGLALTTSAFCLLPYTITMVQMRVFYAMKDSRTPTLIMAIMVLVKIPLFLLCLLLDSDHLIYGVTFVNAFGFVIGAVVGQVWLRRRLGDLDSKPVLITMGKTLFATIWGAAAALLIVKLFHNFGSALSVAWPTLIIGAIVGLAVTLGGMWVLRVAELTPAINRIVRLVKR
ncbi:murein biosynthesis integral membrane protein MurJ [Sciscionella sediminilitoris]|uniref:murein biosynthesis integral membrane protein MurJ n=1 Tax=Sciscionella sediminilitoris TaxID=1445613 RepID=UPI000A450335|nr:murein biosynthesis integral membrane protein MurJ [Sciscionella sp. SE31]